ncbi:MAG: PAS domain S-box protein [Candidatus Cryosericum sp.]
MEERSDKHLAGKRDNFSAGASQGDAAQVAARQWQQFLEFSPDPMWIKDAQGRYVAVNNAYQRANPALKTQTVMGKTDFEVLSRDKAEMYAADDQIAIHDGVCEHEFSAVDEEGTLKYYSTKKTALRGADGVLTGVLGQARDITSQRRTELALALENRRSHLFQRVLEAAATATSVGSFLASVLTMSHEFFGFDRGGIYMLDSDGRTARLVSAQGESQAVQEQARSVVADEEPFSQVYRTGRPFVSNSWHNPGSSGHSDDHPLTLVVVPLLNLGHIIGSLNMAWDVPPQPADNPEESLAAIAREISIGMDRIETMAALQENTANLRAFFDSVQGFFFVFNRDGKILAVGEQGARRLGRTPTELVGTNINDLYPEEERELSRVILGDMINGTRTSSTQTLVAADGTQIPVNTLVTRGSWNGGLALFSASQDITGSRRAAEALAADRRRADALYNIIEAASRAQTTEEFLPEALSIALDTTSFEGGGIYMVDGDRAVLACTKGLGHELIERIRSVPVNEEPYRTALRDGKLSVFTGLDQLPPDITQQHRVLSLISIPIAAGDLIIGALNLASSRNRTTEVRTELLMSIGRIIGEAVVRLRADESLRTSQQDFETMFEAMPRLIFVLREDGSIAKVNTAAAQRLGWQANDLRGTSILDLCPPERRAETTSALADLVAGNSSVCTLSLVSHKGELIQLGTRVVRASWGGKPAIFAVSREATSPGPEGKPSR